MPTSILDQTIKISFGRKNLQDVLRFERLRGSAFFHLHKYTVLAAFIVLVCYAASFNKNLPFLVILFSLFVLSIHLVRARSGKLMLLAAFTFVVAAPVPAPRFEIVSQMPFATHKEGLDYAAIPKKGTIEFTFILHDLSKHQRHCGPLTGRLRAHGKDLMHMSVSIDGAVLDSPTIRSFANVHELLEARLTGMVSDTIRLVFKKKENSVPRLALGPESDGLRLFPYAVYLEFYNWKCRVLYHVLPRAI